MKGAGASGTTQARVVNVVMSTKGQQKGGTGVLQTGLACSVMFSMHTSRLQLDGKTL